MGAVFLKRNRNRRQEDGEVGGGLKCAKYVARAPDAASRLEIRMPMVGETFSIRRSSYGAAALSRISRHFGKLVASSQFQSAAFGKSRLKGNRMGKRVIQDSRAYGVYKRHRGN